MNNLEDLPKNFRVKFEQDIDETIKVYFNDKLFGHTLTDNSYETDYYRYHDIFHFSFATILNWSPCVRHLLKLKRKSNKIIDEVEDGARARSIEEGISAIIFEEALMNDYFKVKSVSEETVRFIMQATRRLEVRSQTEDDWKEAIFKSYVAFRYLVSNSGGTIHFDASKRSIVPLS